MKIFQISAFNKEGIQEMFQSLVIDIINSMDEENLKNRASSIKLEPSKRNTNINFTEFNLKSYFTKDTNGNYYKPCC